MEINSTGISHHAHKSKIKVRIHLMHFLKHACMPYNDYLNTMKYKNQSNTNPPPLDNLEWKINAASIRCSTWRSSPEGRWKRLKSQKLNRKQNKVENQNNAQTEHCGAQGHESNPEHNWIIQNKTENKAAGEGESQHSISNRAYKN